MAFKIGIFTLKDIVIYGLLFLTAMNFHAYFFYLSIITLVVLVIFQRKLIANYKSIVYLLLGILLLLYNHSSGVFSIVWSMSYISLYLVGYNFIIIGNKGFDRQVQRKGYFLLSVISSGSFVHYLLNFFVNYGNDLGRNTNDIWTGEIMAATGQVAIACLMMGFAVSMILVPFQKKHRYIGIVCIACMLLYNLILACRTMIVVLLVIFLIGLLYVSLYLDRTLEKARIYIGITLFMLVIVLAFSLNLGGIQEYLLSSNLFMRLQLAFEDTRASSKISYIVNAYKNPFGGLYLREQFGYAHDLLLDGYDEYGIVGLGILVTILLSGTKELIKLIKYTPCNQEVKLAMLCVYFALLLEFCIEPILEGMSWLFACYCLINGCITGINVYYSKAGKRE